MKIYVKAAKEVSTIEMIKSLLGFGYYSTPDVIERNRDKTNFALDNGMWKFSQADADKFRPLLKNALGAKYIQPYLSLGKIYFYADPAEVKRRYDEKVEAKRKAAQEADDKLMEHLRTIDIEQYKPSAAIIKKLKDYRDKGSKVNVKAIKDENKLLTYCYAAHLLGWSELAGSCEADNSFGWRWNDLHKDVFKAMDRLILKDAQYEDTRTDFEKKYDLPDSKGLFTFEEKNCWLPKKILMYFINNNIPVHFGKRTSGASWDYNGRQWSEVEHLTIFPDSDNPINYAIVVHTDEGGGPSTYTGNGTLERTSAKNVIDDIDSRVRRVQN